MRVLIGERGLAPAALRERAAAPSALLLAALLVAVLGVRLWFGMRLPLDADEATTAYSALGILHGHLLLTESDQHYLGALESYWLAPFVRLLGPSLLAVRVAMGLVGVFYVLAMYGLGRLLFRRSRHALLLAALAGFFPVFELTWTMKARSGYAELMVFEAVLLLLTIRLGWSADNPRRRDWALFGLVAGLAMWNDVLVLVPLLVMVLALAMRLLTPGRRQALAGAPYAAIAALAGFSPWLVDQLGSDLRGIHTLPEYSTNAGTALAGLLNRELPIFLGTSGTCDRYVLPPVVAWLIMASVAAAAVWLRREHLAPLLRGQLGRLQPMDMVLGVAPAALLAVTLGRFNATPCEPRYLLPLAIPLALGAALLLMNLARWRSVAAGLGAAYLALAFVTMSGPTVDSQSRTATGMTVSGDPAAAAAFLRRQHLEAVFADYWLARPIQYAAGGDLVVGVYSGPAGFPEQQRLAESVAHPSYLFLSGDPMEGTLEAYMKRHGIQAERVTEGNLVLYKNLSAPVEPADLGAPASY